MLLKPSETSRCTARHLAVLSVVATPDRVFCAALILFHSPLKVMVKKTDLDSTLRPERCYAHMAQATEHF